MRAIAVAFLMIFCAYAAFDGAAQASAVQATPSSSECAVTTEDENVALVDRYANSVWDRTDLDVIDQFLTVDFVHHGITGEIGWEGWPAAFPDLSATLGQFAAEGDLVAGEWSATATHTGEFRDIPPSGNPVAWGGFSVYRIECGKIAEIWNQEDYVGLFRQMGVSVLPELPNDEASPMAAPATDAQATPGAECRATTAAENEEIIRAYSREVWGQPNGDALDADLANDVVHWPAPGLSVQEWRSGFPDLQTTVTEFIAGEDVVYVRSIDAGTQQGAFLGVAPTGVSAEWESISQYRIACGTIEALTVQVDLPGLYRQLGIPLTWATPAAGS